MITNIKAEHRWYGYDGHNWKVHYKKRRKKCQILVSLPGKEFLLVWLEKKGVLGRLQLQLRPRTDGIIFKCLELKEKVTILLLEFSQFSVIFFSWLNDAKNKYFKGILLETAFKALEKLRLNPLVNFT